MSLKDLSDKLRLPEADDSEVEHLARQMCRAQGNDPDRMVTNLIAEHGRGLLHGYRFRESEQFWQPAWQVYMPLARHASVHLKGRA